MRVFACMATSLDGKIGPAGVDQFVAIGSRYDMDNLMALRDEADGILFGASTFRTWPKVHYGNDPARNPHHFIMSRSLDLDLQAELFQHPEIPITIFSGTQKTKTNQHPPDHVEIVSIPEQPGQMDSILKHIQGCGIESLLIEGGGHILYRFMEASALEELYLTLVPKVIGDKRAPALLAGQSLSRPPQVSILGSKQVEDETFLHLEFKYT